MRLARGARLWLVEAGAAGAARVKVKMADALSLTHGPERVDWALGHAAIYGGVGEKDLAAIVACRPPDDRHRANQDHSLQGGTRAWEGFGQ